MNNDLAIFERHEIRRQSVTNRHRLKTGCWRVSQLVTYCYQLLPAGWIGIELVTNCNQLKLPAADGKTVVVPVARKS